MESIKETDLALQREVVTTTPNTWLVEAVNPSTGEKKMINVANLSSVVAGQMGSIKKYPSMFLGIAEDADTLKTTGIYRVNATSTNIPTQYGVLSVDVANDYVHQYLKSAIGDSYSFFSRIFYDNKWTSWQRIDNFGYNTLAELASGVASSIGTVSGTQRGLMPSGSFGCENSVKSARLFRTISSNCNVGCIVAYSTTTGSSSLNWLIVDLYKTANNSPLNVRAKYLFKGGAQLPLKYKVNDDNSVSVYLERTQFTPIYANLMFGQRYAEGLALLADNTELEGAIEIDVQE